MKKAKLKMSLFPQRLRIVGLDEKGKYILRLRPETLDQLIRRLDAEEREEEAQKIKKQIKEKEIEIRAEKRRRRGSTWFNFVLEAFSVE